MSVAKLIDKFLAIIDRWIRGKRTSCAIEAVLTEFVDPETIKRNCCPVCGKCFDNPLALRRHLLHPRSHCRRDLVAILHTAAQLVIDFENATRRSRSGGVYVYKLELNESTITCRTRYEALKRFVEKRLRR